MQVCADEGRAPAREYALGAAPATAGGQPSGPVGLGDILAGRYVLDEPLGWGGTGRVYRAHDRLLDRDVAVKLLLVDGAREGEPRWSCAAEARAAGRVAHDGIVCVLDAGSDAGCPFVVTEFVHGMTLAERLADRVRPGMRDAVALAAQVADALDHAHTRGVIRGDIRPATIVVTAQGRAKLVDVGIAPGAPVLATLSPAELRASAPYLSPEQVRGEPVDGRSDVYALGAVLFELLAGRPPFEGVDVAAVMERRLVTDPPPLRALNPAVPAALDGIVGRALLRDPARRYQTAADLAADLWAVLPTLPECDRPPAAEPDGAWPGRRAGRSSSDLDPTGLAVPARSGDGRLAALEPAIVVRLQAARSAMERGRVGRLAAVLGTGLGSRLVAVSRTLDAVGSGLHQRPPRVRLAAGRASLHARALAMRGRGAEWVMRAAVVLARAAVRAYSASIRAGLVAWATVYVALAMLVRWTVASGRRVRDLPEARAASRTGVRGDAVVPIRREDPAIPRRARRVAAPRRSLARC